MFVQCLAKVIWMWKCMASGILFLNHLRGTVSSREHLRQFKMGWARSAIWCLLLVPREGMRPSEPKCRCHVGTLEMHAWWNCDVTSSTIICRIWVPTTPHQKKGPVHPGYLSFIFAFMCIHQIIYRKPKFPFRENNIVAKQNHIYRWADIVIVVVM